MQNTSTYKNMPVFNNRDNKPYVVDGRVIWDSRSPVVMAVILAQYKDEVYALINKRGKGMDVEQGKWNLPGGYMDWDENGFDAVHREVFEETGVDIIPIRFENFVIKSHLYEPFMIKTEPTGARQNVTLVYGMYFKCNELPKINLEFDSNDEVDEALWVNLKEIDNYVFAFKHNHRIWKYWNLVIEHEII